MGSVFLDKGRTSHLQRVLAMVGQLLLQDFWNHFRSALQAMLSLHLSHWTLRGRKPGVKGEEKRKEGSRGKEMGLI